MKRITVAMTEPMLKALKREVKQRGLESVAQAVRIILGEYLSEYT
jgi:metal-responsive CopG/Arc/MetJ family transcriptional regulator